MLIIEFGDRLRRVISAPELISTTNDIPNILLVANRMTLYDTYSKALIESGVDGTIIYNRTIMEHLFFDNPDILSTVDLDKLIQWELEFLSKFSSSKLVLLENSSDAMLSEKFLGDNSRKIYDSDEDGIFKYHQSRKLYRNFISKLKSPDLILTITDSDYKDLDRVTTVFADQIELLFN